jgi:histidine triad (HIT) family protein
MQDSSCIFCKIANSEIPSKKVYETEDIFAFHDINPITPIHILIIPKKHIATINDLAPEDAQIMGNLTLAAKQIAKDMQIAPSGYRLVINCGPDAIQSVFHIHVHLMAGQKMGWPPFPGASRPH